MSSQRLSYLLHPDKFKTDIEKIFRNAKSYNFQSTEIHKLAVKMNEKCHQILYAGRIWEMFEINSKVTHDEMLHMEYIRNKNDKVEPKFSLKPKDLFLQHE